MTIDDMIQPIKDSSWHQFECRVCHARRALRWQIENHVKQHIYEPEPDESGGQAE